MLHSMQYRDLWRCLPETAQVVCCSGLMLQPRVMTCEETVDAVRTAKAL